MPAEFNKLVSDILSIIDKQKAIADNSGIDDIDLTSIIQDVESLANSAFTPSNISMATIISLREAYDYVASQSRINSVYNYTRENYYSNSGDQLDKLSAFMEYLKAILVNLENIAGK